MGVGFVPGGPAFSKLTARVSFRQIGGREISIDCRIPAADRPDLGGKAGCGGPERRWGGRLVAGHEPGLAADRAADD